MIEVINFVLLSGHVVQLRSKYLCYAQRLALLSTTARGASFRDGQQLTGSLNTGSSAENK